jgi:membrane-bound lytic murein transglycosylase
MFLRFVTIEQHDESHQELDIFHAARYLRDNGSLSQAEEELLQEIRDWFNNNLEKPTRFMSAKPPYYRKRRKTASRGLKIQRKNTLARCGK